MPPAAMLSVEEALRVAVGEAQRGRTHMRDEVSCADLASLLGRVLAEDVHSPNPVPAYRASIKDGYAVSAAAAAAAAAAVAAGLNVRTSGCLNIRRLGFRRNF